MQTLQGLLDTGSGTERVVLKRVKQRVAVSTGRAGRGARAGMLPAGSLDLRASCPR